MVKKNKLCRIGITVKAKLPLQHSFHSTVEGWHFVQIFLKQRLRSRLKPINWISLAANTNINMKEIWILILWLMRDVYKIKNCFPLKLSKFGQQRNKKFNSIFKMKKCSDLSWLNNVNICAFCHHLAESMGCGHHHFPLLFHHSRSMLGEFEPYSSCPHRNQRNATKTQIMFLNTCRCFINKCDFMTLTLFFG